MIQNLTIQQAQENRISYYHLAAFIILLPFDRFYSEMILISLLLHSFIRFNRTKWRSVFTMQNLVLSSVFLLTLIGIIYSSDKTQGLKDVQRQLAILLCPCIFSILHIDLSAYRDRLLKILGITCAVAILYLYADALRILLYYKLPLRSLFSPSFINHNFSEPIDLHATYFSMYCSLGLAAFFYFLLKEKQNHQRIMYIIGIGMLLAGLIQLASRAVLIVTIFLVVPGIGFTVLRKAKLLQFAGIWLILVGTGVLGIAKLDSFKKRYVADLKNDLTQASVNNEVLEPRLQRWHYVWQLVKQKPVVGHGSGSEKRLLKDIYFENGLYNSYLHELNAHNQYLSILLKHGFIGLIVFLLTLAYGFIQAWKRKDMLFATFLSLIAMISFSENLLDVNKGIFFYAFFFSFFNRSKPFSSFSRLGG